MRPLSDCGIIVSTLMSETEADTIPHSNSVVMQTDVLTSLGKIAGLGGIAVGVLMLVFRDVLNQKLLPETGLNSDQAYHIIWALVVFTFGIASIGVIAWIVGRAVGPERPAPLPAMIALLVFAAAVLASALAVGMQRVSQPQASQVKQPEKSRAASPPTSITINSSGANAQNTGVNNGTTKKQ